jgi:predicted ATPase/DNA-binding CsgD family transcriptional regulator
VQTVTRHQRRAGDRLTAAVPLTASAEGVLLVGRDAELSRLRRHLSDAGVRLLTLTGPGGVGKSRLAAVALRQLPGRDPLHGGIAVADLAAVPDAAGLAVAVAAALGLPAGTPGPGLPERLAAQAEHHAVLLLDNCEHVAADVAALVGELLARSRGIRVVATSREPLQVHGEHLFPVAPLTVPAEGTVKPEELHEVASVRLFVGRARAARPGFTLGRDNRELIAELCRLVDGLPLALEIAAARVRLFHPRVVLAHLRQGLDILSGRPTDTLSRFSSMRSCLARGIDTLAEDERSVFADLGVFAASFELEAAEAVAGVPTAQVPVILERLVDKSLLVVQEQHDPARLSWQPRFSMLQTTRMFARELLMLGDRSGAVRERHARYYQDVAARCSEERRASLLPGLRQERGNLEAAMDYLADTGRVAEAARIAIALASQWQAAGTPERGLEYLEALLAEELPQELRERAMDAALRLAGRPAEPAGEAVTASPTDSTPEVAALPGLTPRETEVAVLVARGLTNRVIARRLGISEWTAVNHVRNVMRKLDCPSRVHIAVHIANRVSPHATRPS